MDLPKCALNHIPVVRDDVFHMHIRKDKPAGVVTLCSECRPMRRCPECPTEYLIELKLVEDKEEPQGSFRRFNQGLIVTRWSDLGDGSNPITSPEWAAVNGEKDDYDSFAEIGRRAVSGIFESAYSDTIPGQRILSMNPRNIKKGEEGHSWY